MVVYDNSVIYSLNVALAVEMIIVADNSFWHLTVFNIIVTCFVACPAFLKQSLHIYANQNALNSQTAQNMDEILLV